MKHVYHFLRLYLIPTPVGICLVAISFTKRVFNKSSLYRISSNRDPGLYFLQQSFIPGLYMGPASNRGGLYLFLYSGNLPYVLIDSAFYRRRVMAASQVVPRGVYEKESVVRGHHILEYVA